MNSEELEKQALYYKAIEDYRSKSESLHEEALLFLKEAADKGSNEAVKLLGVLYMSGQYAPYPKRDMRLAIHYYELAAADGDEEAMYWLGQCYEMGLGVEKDPEKAEIWKAKAIEAGFVPADDNDDEPETVQVGGKTEDEPEESTAPISVTQVTFTEHPLEDHEPTYEEEDDPGEAGEVAEEPAAADDHEAQADAAQAEGADETPAKTDDAPAAQSGETEETAEAPQGIAEMQAKAEAAQEKDPETLRLEAEKKTERGLMIRYGLVFGGGVFLAVYLIFQIIFLIARKPLTAEGSPAGTIFWIAAAVLTLGGAAVAAYFGIRRAKEHAERIAEYHRTPFYEGFRAEPGKMDEQTAWCYKLYRSLERSYLPAPLFTPAERETLEAYHGVMYTGWTYRTSRDIAEPQFVIATKKAIYVVRTQYLKGRMEGGLEDAEWVTRQDAAAEGSGEENQAATGRILNMVEENDMNLRTVRSQLQLTSPLPIESIPFYNVLMFSTDTVIRALRIAQAGENVMVCQGGPDRLRSVIAMHESHLENHEVALPDLMDVFEEIRRKQK